MGKLRALKLGITKGVQHAVEYGNRQTFRRAVEFTLVRLKCNQCGHPSRAHTRVLPGFAPLVGEELFKLVKGTQNKETGGFDECTFYYCDECEYLACEGHHDQDSCNGRHDEVQRQYERSHPDQ